jgi:hypothetical protein
LAANPNPASTMPPVATAVVTSFEILLMIVLLRWACLSGIAIGTK